MSVATRRRVSSFTVTARLAESSGVPADSLSKNVYSSWPIASGSCCQAKISPALSRVWPGAARSVKLLALPPSCQMILPVKRLTLYVVQVSRASISRLPSVSMWTALMWNQSHGVLGEAGSALLALAEGDVVLAVPLEQNLAGPDVDFLDDAVDHGLVGGRRRSMSGWRWRSCRRGSAPCSRG